jgi:hypothetical protein
MTEQSTIWQMIFTAVLSGTVVSAILGLIFHRRLKSVEARLNEELQRNVEIFRTTRAWKEAAISELFGPMVMQFDRVKRAFNRYKRKNIYLETKVIAEGNTTIKTLLLSHGHLIPAELLDDAGRLVEHFEVWLEEFERVRDEKKPELETQFVFVGPQGFGFPRQSEQKFVATFHNLRKEVYGI